MYSYTSAGLTTKKRLRITRDVSGPLPTFYESYDLDATYVYDNEAHMTTLTYPTAYTADQFGNLTAQPGLTYTYTYDAMGRPYSLIDNQAPAVHYVNTVVYNAANQPTSRTGSVSGTWQYNTRVQLTRINEGYDILCFAKNPSWRSSRLGSCA
jgi:YD repeat-containing protein